MYLTLLRLNPLSREVARDMYDVTQLHRTVMGAFPEAPGGENPREHYRVLHRLDVHHRSGVMRLYVQSNLEPDWSHLPGDYTIGTPGAGIAVKPIGDVYASIGEGRRLRFRLRANPTRKIDTKTRDDGVRRNGRRVPVRGEQEQVAWLKRQGERFGFVLSSVTIKAAGSPELGRSRYHNRTFQGVLYEGSLLVTDRDAFQQALTGGIGPAKAFGYGMLSISSE